MEGKLPPYLLGFEPILKTVNGGQAVEPEQISGLSLAEAVLKYKVKRLIAKDRSKAALGAASLLSTALGVTAKILNSCSQAAYEEVLPDGLDDRILRMILTDFRLSYKALRIVLANRYALSEAKLKALDIDLDDTIRRNERRLTNNVVEDYAAINMLYLDDLPDGLPDTNFIGVYGTEVLQFPRCGLGAGSLGLLDRLWTPAPRILKEERAFREAFAMYSAGILEDLDWSNTVVCGRSVLYSLLYNEHYPSWLEHTRRQKEFFPTIDLHLYGLNVEEANAKLKDIEKTWRNNTSLGLPTNEVAIIKTADRFVFITRVGIRLQVHLRIFKSALDVLLSRKLDIYALGFDGKRVLMIPRFVRALETGYSIMTTELADAQHTGSSCNYTSLTSPADCLFSAAAFGFGVRFLPSHVHALDHHWLINLTASDKRGSRANEWQKRLKASRTGELRLWPSHRGSSGLKILKRVVYHGRRHLHSYAFDDRFLQTWQLPQRLRDQKEQWILKHGPHALEWEDVFDEADIATYATLEHRLAPTGTHYGLHAQPDSRFFTYALPATQYQPYQFHCENFMRQCELWNCLQIFGEAWLARQPQESIVEATPRPEPEVFLPEYLQDDASLALENIAVDNTAAWDRVKCAICRRLSVPVQQFSFQNYVTRRLRIQTGASSMPDVVDKQLTLPVLVSASLEHYILHGLQEEYPSLPEHLITRSDEITPCLLPMYDPHRPDTNQNIPPLRDVADERGNFRWLVYTDSTMWRGQDEVMEAVQDVLLALSQVFFTDQPSSVARGTPQPPPPPTARWADGGYASSAACTRDVANKLRRNGLVDLDLAAAQWVHDMEDASGMDTVVDMDMDVELGPGLPEASEAIQFRRWVLGSCFPSTSWPSSENGRKESEPVIEYPYPDAKFWDTADDAC